MNYLNLHVVYIPCIYQVIRLERVIKSEGIVGDNFALCFIEQNPLVDELLLGYKDVR